MPCKISPVIVVALALGPGAAPAFAQPAPAPVAASEASTEGRTLEQNRRVLVGQPAAPEVLRGTAAEPGAPAARGDRAGATPTGGASQPRRLGEGR